MARIELNNFNTKELAVLEQMDDGNPATGAMRTDDTGDWVNSNDAGIAKFRDAYITRFQSYVGNTDFAKANPRIVTLFNELQKTLEPADKISLRGVKLSSDAQAQPVKAAFMPIFELTAPSSSLMEIPIQWIKAYIATQMRDHANPLYPDASAYATLALSAAQTDGIVSFADIAGLVDKEVASDLRWHFFAATHYSQATLILPTGRHVRADTFIDPVSGYVNIRLTDALDDASKSPAGDDASQAYLATTGDPYYLGVAPLGVFTKEELQSAMAGLGGLLSNTDPHAFMTFAEQLGR